MSVKVKKVSSSHCQYYTVGSWFPTGYYGHYRSRPRVDFVNEYRQLAKPQPPQRFIQRSSGLGRKIHPDRSGTFDPNILSWPPYRTNPNLERPLTSTYRKDYPKEEPNVQLLVKRPQTSFDNTLTTTYRSVHGKDSPNHSLINALNNEALLISARSRLYQARKKKTGERETVASCLTWYKAPVPPATSQTNHNNETQPSQEAGMNADNIAMACDTLSAQESQTTTCMTE